jgi:hypothetical protein
MYPPACVPAIHALPFVTATSAKKIRPPDTPPPGWFPPREGSGVPACLPADPTHLVGPSARVEVGTNVAALLKSGPAWPPQHPLTPPPPPPTYWGGKKRRRSGVTTRLQVSTQKPLLQG